MKTIRLFFATLLAANFALGQNITLQKAPADNTLTSTSRVLVVPTGGSITATGTGTIIATGGTATTVPWSGVTGTPTTLAGYGITSPLLPTVGGTGQSTWTLGDFLYANGTNTLAKLAGNTSATLAVLTQTGTGTVSAAPVWTSTTGTGNIVRATSPTLVTPTLGAATATSITGAASTDLALNGGSGTSNVVLTASGAGGNIYARPGASGYVRVDTGLGMRVEAGTLNVTTTTGTNKLGTSTTDGDNSRLHIVTAATAGNAYALNLRNPDASNTHAVSIGLSAESGQTGTSLSEIKAIRTGIGTGYHDLVFSSWNGAALSERMRIVGGAAGAGGVTIASTSGSVGSTSGALQVAGGIYAGAASVFGGALTNRIDQNASTDVYVRNGTTGTAASSSFVAYDGTYLTQLGLINAGFTTSGPYVANSSHLSSNAPAGLRLISQAGEMRFYSSNTLALTLAASTQAATFAGDVTISKSSAKLTLNDTADTTWSLRASAGYLTFGNTTNAIDPLSLTGSTLASAVLNLSSTKSASSSTVGALTIGNGSAATNVAIGAGNVNAGGTLTVGGIASVGAATAVGIGLHLNIDPGTFTFGAANAYIGARFAPDRAATTGSAYAVSGQVRVASGTQTRGATFISDLPGGTITNFTHFLANGLGDRIAPTGNYSFYADSAAGVAYIGNTAPSIGSTSGALQVAGGIYAGAASVFGTTGTTTFGATNQVSQNVLIGASNVSSGAALYAGLSQQLNYGYGLIGYNITGTPGSDSYTSPKSTTGGSAIEFQGSSGVMRFLYHTGATTGGNTVAVTEAMRFNNGAATFAGAVKSTSPSGGIGYGTGAGAAVTQLTSKATTVVSNFITGKITTAADALAKGDAVSFTFTNSRIEANDVVMFSIQSGATAGEYNVFCDSVSAGSCRVSIKHYAGGAGGSLSEALVINYVVIKGASS